MFSLVNCLTLQVFLCAVQTTALASEADFQDVQCMYLCIATCDILSAYKFDN